MTLYHFLTLTVGAGMAITGALTGTAGILMPMSTLIVGGALGHMAQPKTTP